MSRHTLSVLVENKPGILARVASLFSRRGFNIDSLAVGTTEHPEISRMTIVVDHETRSQVLETVELFRARVIDVAPDAVTIEATGSKDKLDALIRVLEPFGIKELVQSGMVAIGRGARSITDRSLRAIERSA